MKTKFQITDPIKRIDYFLSKELNISKNQIKNLIDRSLVLVNGVFVKKAGQSLKPKDIIEILKFQETLKSCDIKIDFDIEIIYEDEDILILNKPPSLVVHKAPSVKETTLVDWLKHKGFTLSTLSNEERFGIIHRLDKDTSGGIIIAKNNFAHTILSNQLKDKSLGRYYLALIQGELKKTTIECNIGRNPKNRLKMANLDSFRQKNLNARYSKTDFIPLLKNENNLQLIAAKLYTGRTHQIRVHLESLNRHIIGDILYGKNDCFNTRILLHAYLVYFIHPRTGKKMLFKVPVFTDMLEFLKKNFNEADLNEYIQEDFILRSFN